MPKPDDAQPGTSDDQSEAIFASGWRQGSVVGVSLTTQILQTLGAAAEDVKLAVISTDCDVTASSFEREPTVELLQLRVLRSELVDGALAWGKNPRVLQFEAPCGASRVVYEVVANDSLRIDRRLLVSHAPDDTARLSPEATRLLSVWMSKRYHRAAFPDAFNRRVSSALTRINKELRRGGFDITGLYVVLVNVELEERVPYEIELVGALLDDAENDPDRRKVAQQAFDEVAAAVSHCEGIDLLEADLRSETEIRLSELKVLRRWDFDQLSFREEPAGEMTPPQV